MRSREKASPTLWSVAKAVRSVDRRKRSRRGSADVSTGRSRRIQRRAGGAGGEQVATTKKPGLPPRGKARPLLRFKPSAHPSCLRAGFLTRDSPAGRIVVGNDHVPTGAAGASTAGAASVGADSMMTESPAQLPLAQPPETTSPPPQLEQPLSLTAADSPQLEQPLSQAGAASPQPLSQAGAASPQPVSQAAATSPPHFLVFRLPNRPWHFSRPPHLAAWSLANRPPWQDFRPLQPWPATAPESPPTKAMATSAKNIATAHPRKRFITYLQSRESNAHAFLIAVTNRTRSGTATGPQQTFQPSIQTGSTGGIPPDNQRHSPASAAGWRKNSV